MKTARNALNSYANIARRVALPAMLIIALAAASALLPQPARAGEFQFVNSWGGLGTDSGQFVYPRDVDVDPAGNIFIVGTNTHSIQKLSGKGEPLTSWGSWGTDDGKFKYPSGIAVGPKGNIYVADTINHRIQKFKNDGTYLDQWGSWGTDDGKFKYPSGIAVAPNGNIYVADTNNNRIQRFDSNGTYKGQWGSVGMGKMQFIQPSGIAVAPSGNVYVTDRASRVQRFTGDGVYITEWGNDGTNDGEFYDPAGIAVGPKGNIYVVDMGNNRIQKFTSNGDYLGQWGTEGTGVSEFKNAFGIAVAPNGNIYVADSGNNRIQVFAEVEKKQEPISPAEPPLPQPQPPLPPQPPPPPIPPKPFNLKRFIEKQPASAFRSACNVQVTSPRLKTKGRSRKRARVTKKKARRLFTHGAKGFVKWGTVAGRDVKCEKIKMVLLQKRGSRYYIPGTGKRVSVKSLKAERFSRTVRRLKKKKKVGKLRTQERSSVNKTKFSFKDFNRSSKLGRRALKRLRKRSYRGTYVLFYSAEIEGVSVLNRVTVRVLR